MDAVLRSSALKRKICMIKKLTAPREMEIRRSLLDILNDDLRDGVKAMIVIRVRKVRLDLTKAS